MKSAFVAVACAYCFCTFTGDASAQAPAPVPNASTGPSAPTAVDPPARWAIMIDPLAIGLGAATGILNAGVRVQYAFSEHVGIAVAPSFAYYAPAGATVYGGGAQLALHVSLSGRMLSRWFVRPFVDVGYATGSSASGNSASFGGLAAGAELGYAWTWAPGFILSLAGGVQYITFFGGESDMVSVSRPVFPKLSLSMGYCW